MSSGTFDPEQLIAERLQGKAAELAACLERRDMSGAFSVIENINAVREESIYYGLGLLARQLLGQQFFGFQPLPGRMAAVIELGQADLRAGLMQEGQGLLQGPGRALRRRPSASRQGLRQIGPPQATEHRLADGARWHCVRTQ